MQPKPQTNSIKAGPMDTFMTPPARASAPVEAGILDTRDTHRIELAGCDHSP